MKLKYIMWTSAILLIVASFWVAYPTNGWNQKLTLVISTPDGDKTGSAIVNAWVTNSPRIMEHVGGPQHHWRGEATMVDLGDGRYVFALMNEPIYMATNSFIDMVIPIKMKGISNPIIDPKTLYPRFKYIRETRPVKSKNNYPTLVTFEDINNPETAIKIDANDLGAIFGEGYKIKEMILEITDDNFTSGPIGKLLKWVNNEFYSSHQLDGNRLHYREDLKTFSNQLNMHHFKKID